MLDTLRNNRLLLIYLSGWFLYGALLFVLPVQSLFAAGNDALFYTFAYVAISCLSVIFCETQFRNLFREPRDGQFLINGGADKLLVLVNFLAMAGIFLHLYDKVMIMGIDYSRGIAAARHEWISKGVGREGISSWQSALGHIFSNFSILQAILLIMFWEKLSGRTKALTVILFFVTTFVYSGTLGSRSTALVNIAVCLGAVILRPFFGLKSLPGSKRFKVWSSSIVLFSFILYTFFVFGERARAQGGSMVEYTTPFFKELSAIPTDNFEIGESVGGPVSDLFYVSVLTGMYVAHSQWTFDRVVSEQERSGQSSLNMVYSVLTKMGLMSAEDIEERSFGGVLINLPGGIWFDFDVTGLIVFALFHGALIFLANALLASSPGWVSVAFFMFVATLSILSPVNSLANMMSFPFVVISLVSLVGIGQIHEFSRLK